jgi:inorganic phosphate transporter, PiT family
MILFFLTSGLFLGWSLGANDAANVFGSAVGSRMVTFKKAAAIASVAVIMGAVLQGAGGSQTLGKLGTINAVGGAFTVALSAAVTVYLMVKFALPVSTTQAIVGAIIGWNFFTGNSTDIKILSRIVATWIIGPVIGALFSVALYILLKKIKRIANIHLIRYESYIRTGLLFTGAFGAYSLGANNIANVVGVFLPAFNFTGMNAGFFILDSDHQLFLLGGLAIAAGIITYSKRTMETIGVNIVELSSEAALVVVLAQSLVLFIFSSSGLSSLFVKAGLPPIPMVPVSSTQVIVGCIVGIGLYKGVRNINFRLVRDIAIGWLTTPVASGLLAFISLYFVKNIFNINVGTEAGSSPILSDRPDEMITGITEISSVIRYFLLGVVVFGLAAITYNIILERKKRAELKKSEEKFWKNLK